eukprot:Phypoly_transcript_12184.p1 GENE.Phypoly_transcript_12184~~Phypoly_transcript_12184.p1  ORF type:complete len:316 (+),score=31.44 Phypoly_transcript_12184:135-1082(+)
MYVVCLLFVALIQAHASTQVTVSGISSGGAMAVQFHVAHSSIVAGAGIVAGAPYYCAQGTMAGALTCMSNPSIIALSALYAETTYAYSMGSIDSPSNLKSSKVYLYSGKNDTIVNPVAMQKTQQYYLNYVPSASIKAIFDIPSEHAFITSNFGSACAYLGIPFINNCNYDMAGDILSYFYGKLQPVVTPIDSNIITLAQAKFVPIVGLDAASLADNAYLYVPSKCASGGCAAHIAFHGCEQTLTDINTTFVKRAGYNGWAEANNIVILYPQAKKTTMNPKGCWDWWGYTGAAYASQLGVQITTVKNMVDYVTGKF